MKCMAASFFLIALFGLIPRAHADINQIEAREIARNNNCAPSNIEVFKKTLGTQGSTVYKVDCTMPDVKDSGGTKPDSALLITCDQSLCELLGPVAGESK